MAGPVEADPEYQLIVDSNNILVEIDNEISKLQLAIVTAEPCLTVDIAPSGHTLSHVFGLVS